MENTAIQAIQSVLSAQKSFCKFLSANDTGLTGGHQAGIYISKPAVPILFDEPGVKGENKEKWANISWFDGSETRSRFIYYGQGTRNEYRVTNFGRGFPYLRPEYTGALFVFTQQNEEAYTGFILNSDDEIDQFLDAFGLSPADTNKMIDISFVAPEKREEVEMDKFIKGLTVDFPQLFIGINLNRSFMGDDLCVYDHSVFIEECFFPEVITVFPHTVIFLQLFPDIM